MEHVAIDLGSRESQVCVRDERGDILLERKVATAKLGAYLSKRPHSRVILETCAEAFFVADGDVLLGVEQGLCDFERFFITLFLKFLA